MTAATGIVGEYLDLKRETDADLLAMQCGDFYEFFAEDAELVSEELDLQVSQKSSHGSSYPMAGVPVDDLEPYVTALVERGYRVAVADQYETDGGHAREVTRVVTPGTTLERGDAAAQYLVAVVREGDDAGGTHGLALTDVTTGRFMVAEREGVDETLAELGRFDPAEVLPGPTLRGDDEFLERGRSLSDATTLHETAAFAPGRARSRVGEQFGADAVDSVGLDPAGPAVRAAGAALSYVEETGTGVLASITRLREYRGDDRVALDATTRRNLELTETMQGDGDGSLLATVDHTVTAPGRRLLEEWLTAPREDLATLERRQDSVAALAGAALARDRVRETLGSVADLERLAARATSGSADARALVGARETLATLPDLADVVAEDPTLADSPLGDVLADPDRAAAADLAAELRAALVADPPGTVSEGGLFREGYDDDLDDAIERHEQLRGYFEELEAREKRRTGLTHVTVDRNKTDGYYVQVGKSEADQVPDEYEEIKTLKNSRRFTTAELDEKERELFRAEERRADLERELFDELRDRVAEHAALLQDVGRTLATVDALTSLAVHAVDADWTRPTLTDGDALDIRGGRHPVVERTTEFVPNDLQLGGGRGGAGEGSGAGGVGETDGPNGAATADDRSFLLVTGPNMSGKSTYMRQSALIVLLAQVGSFVPAESAEIGVVDGIYTRVGALDELAQGRSTFMVEMAELSNILHSATENSLVVLDEVGRGTATYDGISIAWAATEYLHNEVRAKTLFATHYHELTELADRLPGVANVHMAAEERGGDVTFLRTVRGGPADRSYGVHVADLAGVPAPVVDRSREVLRRLREDEALEVRGAGGAGDDGGEPRQVVFDLDAGGLREATDGGDAASADDALDPETEAVVEELRDASVDEIPPVELMARVREWQERLED
jgi:DNA mismatch repair protein MutS